MPDRCAGERKSGDLTKSLTTGHSRFVKPYGGAIGGTAGRMERSEIARRTKYISLFCHRILADIFLLV